MINNFNFPGIGLQGAAFSGGLDDYVRPSTKTGYAGGAVINEDATASPNKVPINDYDTIFATSLGVIGDVATNYVYNAKGVAQLAGSGQERAYRWYQTEAYFGDNWKMNSKLTFSYGVRYQLYTVPYETHGEESVPSPIPFDTFIRDRIAQQNSGNTSNTGLPFYSYVLGGKANNGPALYQPNYKDFAPRVAFSFTPWNSGKTVFHAGAGIVYDRTVIDTVNFLQDQLSALFSNQNIDQQGSSGGADASLASDVRVGANLAYPANLIPAPTPITLPYTPYVDSTGTPYGLAAGVAGFVISPTLKDPYSIAINAGVEQELPGHMILKLNYAGRLGRRLLADADANQVIDVPDYTHGSTQSMAQAFAGLTAQLRAGDDYTNVTPQPWFEDVLTPIFGPGQNTSAVAYYVGQLAERGDISDSLYNLAYLSYFYGFGFLPANIGIPAQYGTNAYLTNKGSSNYHGMLVTLDKNISNGLRFEFNYTWSHSIDNTSLSANSNPLYGGSTFATELICDVLKPRACRADSDFDERQGINSNFTYQLPFGRGKQFGGSMARGWDEAVGGWEISGLPLYRTACRFPQPPTLTWLPLTISTQPSSSEPAKPTSRPKSTSTIQAGLSTPSRAGQQALRRFWANSVDPWASSTDSATSSADLEPSSLTPVSARDSPSSKTSSTSTSVPMPSTSSTIPCLTMGLSTLSTVPQIMARLQARPPSSLATARASPSSHCVSSSNPTSINPKVKAPVIRPGLLLS